MYRDGAPYGEEPTCGECRHFRDGPDCASAFGWCARFKPVDTVYEYERACDAFEDWRPEDD